MDRAPRVHHEAPSSAGECVVLDAEETHHVARVLRLRPGAAIAVFDGRGREWGGVLLSVDGGRARVRLGDERTDAVEAGFPVVLYQALCRSERMEWVVQKGTEVGLVEVRPFAARRCDAPPPSPERLVRWRRVALEASKQSGRRIVPHVADVEPAIPPPPPPGVIALLMDLGAGSVPLGEILASPCPAAAWIAVGPEGGFEGEEVAALERSRWVRCSLGPRTLRTETAGVVACALVLHAWADLGSPRGSAGG